MANEKQNTVRILQLTKKNNLSPVIHSGLGFLGGVVFTSFLGIVYLNFATYKQNSIQHTVSSEHKNTQVEPEIQLDQATKNSEADSDGTHLNVIENHQNFEQDLVNAFKHPKSDTPVTKQNLAITETVIAKNLEKPSQLSAKPKPNTAVKQPQVTLAKAHATKESNQITVVKNPEIESPQGSVQMTVTKTELPVKDTVITP